MELNKIVIITVIFGLFFLLITFGVAYVPTILHFPEWWFGLLGKNNFSTLLFMHISHFSALVLASIPIVFLLCYFVKIHILRITIIYGALMSTFLIKDIYIAHDNYVSSFTFSNTIDVIKFFFTLSLVTWLYLRISSAKKTKKDT